MELFPFLIKRLLIIRCKASLCQCITHPYCASFYTKNPRPHTQTEDILCFFFYFSASKKNCHRHLNGFGDISLTSLVCNRAKSSKKLFFIQWATRVKLLEIFVAGNSLLNKKRKDITAKHQDERIAGSTYRIYSCHFARSTHFYFTKSGKRKMRLGVGVEGWELTGRL